MGYYRDPSNRIGDKRIKAYVGVKNNIMDLAVFVGSVLRDYEHITTGIAIENTCDLLQACPVSVANVPSGDSGHRSTGQGRVSDS